MRSLEALVQDIDFNMTGLAGQPTLKAAVIAGLVVNKTSTLEHRNLPRNMKVRYTEITLANDEQAQRLVAFFERFFTQPAAKTTYDCHSFMGFLQGWDDDIATEIIPFRHYTLDSRHSAEAQPGIPYAAISTIGDIQHSMTGLGANQCLSILGEGVDSPLVISEVTATMKVYGAATMKAVLSHQDLC